MKTFQFFKEDSQEAKERQLQSLEDLTHRREQAKTRASQLSGSFKERSKKRIKRIKKTQKEINLRRKLVRAKPISDS